jgi:putative hydrolase of the HAD superfamily
VSEGIQALLFDLGGVVIDIDFERVLRHWARLSRYTEAQLRARCVLDDLYERYERNEVGDAEFFDHVRRVLALQADDAEIAAGWNAIFVGLNREVMAQVAATTHRVPSFVLTNTSACHQATWTRAYPVLFETFRGVYASTDLGMRKPERRAFDAVVARIGVDPGRILFFDDMPQNVEGARCAGLQAVLVGSPGDVAAALAAAGLG